MGGASVREVAGQFGLSKTAVDRHKQSHLGPVTEQAAAARAAMVAAAEAEVVATLVDTTRSTLQQVQDLGTVARQCLDRVTDPSVEFVARDVAAIMQQVRGALELQAKLLGELAPTTAVQINNFNQVREHPAVAGLLDAIAKVIESKFGAAVAKEVAAETETMLAGAESTSADVRRG